eukprot:scaffold27882_cov61-Phaeocystis_antarctica.AAC.10
MSGRPIRFPTTTTAVAGLAALSHPSSPPGRRKSTMPSLSRNRLRFREGGCLSAAKWGGQTGSSAHPRPSMCSVTGRISSSGAARPSFGPS